MAEKSRISWRDEGEELQCVLPNGEVMALNMSAIDPSWNGFLLRYGVAQWVGSSLAKLSSPLPQSLAADIAQAKLEVAQAVAVGGSMEKEKAEEKLKRLKEEVWQLKVINTKNRLPDTIKLINEHFSSLKEEMKEQRKREKKTSLSELIQRMKAAGMSADAIAAITAGL